MFLSQGDMINHSFDKHFLKVCYFLGLMPDAGARKKGSTCPQRAPRLVRGIQKWSITVLL